MCTTEKMHSKSEKSYATFPLSRMTRCNTATLALESISIFQIAFSFFLTDMR